MITYNNPEINHQLTTSLQSDLLAIELGELAPNLLTQNGVRAGLLGYRGFPPKRSK